VATSVNEQFFLVFGIPKCGATFLQRRLNMHPEVSSPSEQTFSPLLAGLTVVLDQYRSTLRPAEDDRDLPRSGRYGRLNLASQSSPGETGARERRRAPGVVAQSGGDA